MRREADRPHCTTYIGSSSPFEMAADACTRGDSTRNSGEARSQRVVVYARFVERRASPQKKREASESGQGAMQDEPDANAGDAAEGHGASSLPRGVVSSARGFDCRASGGFGLRDMGRD